METGWRWDQKSLIGELLQGMELTKQLRTELSTASAAAQSRRSLVQGIISSYEKALLIMKWSGPVSPPGNLPESPLSANGSPSSDDSSRGGLKDLHDQKEGSKKRKTQPRWTEQVRVNSEMGFEGFHEDGYSWRKYGQKDILGAKYPRSYYRCTFRNTQNCWAIKQVQRSDEDPSVFKITYRGKHTCSQGNFLIQSLCSPEKQKKENDNGNDDKHQKQTSRENLPSYQTMEGLIKSENKKATTLCFGSSSVEGKDINDISHLAIDIDSTLEGAYHVQHAESDLKEIFSVNTCADNSPILSWDLLDAEPIYPDFPFDSPGFFY